ncbi:MAG: hypothetical protein ABIO46_00645, partial [Chitinophagales bacterium]
GLIRVLIAVIPCAGIICLRGFNLITDWKVICTNEVVKKLVTVLLVVSVLLTPYIQLKTQCAFDLSGNQKSILKASEKYKKFLDGHTIYSSAGYSAIVFNYDLFDSSQYRRLQEINQLKKIPVGSAIVWDDFYTNESRIAHSNLLFDERFELLETFESADCMGYPNKSAVFMYKGEPAINWMVSDTLFSHGFEAISTTARKSEVFYSGTSSCYVDAVNPYSPGLIMKAGSAPLILPATIRISAMFNPTQIPFDKNMHAQFVASLTHNGVDYFWQSFDVDNMLRNNKTWENVSFKLLIPAAKDTADVLKIYIWNPHKTGIYVDDLLIEQLQEKD